MENKKQTEETEELKPQMMAIETPINVATGFGISAARDLVIISFIFSPPEDSKIVRILSRIALLPEAAEALSKSINEALGKIAKEKKKEPESK
jgi:tRNA U34 5-methylaminomethyl-2-thiouridine-forming methyltransferase MnmC